MFNNSKPSPRVAIIGGGFSGLCMGIRLKQAGIDTFTIFEKAASLGGTWRENTYPGACCDTKAFAYCYSFEQKTDWTSKWVSWHEILDYMDHCANKYDLKPHMRFNTEIARAQFDKTEGTWTLTTREGKEIVTDILISGVGQLNRPSIPNIPGEDRFQGEMFHSAQWNHDYDFSGKKVAVIDNAASAIQFIPEVAKQAEDLKIFQRSANWMIKRGNRPFTEREKRLLGSSRLLSRLYRTLVWSYYEFLIYPVIRGVPGFKPIAEWVVKNSIRQHVVDPELRQILVPDYPIGAKRILVSDDYYPSLNRDNVHIVTAGVDRITENAVITKAGVTHRVDAIIFGTGFKSTEFLAPMAIRGLEGKSLNEQWNRNGAEAYLGMTVPGYPNFFMIYGPNTNLGHYSIVFIIERQTQYILQCIRLLVEKNSQYLDLRFDAFRQFNEKLQQKLQRTAWAKVSHSWYMREGKITNNWGASTSSYWWNTRRVNLKHYHFEPRGESAKTRSHEAVRPVGPVKI